MLPCNTTCLPPPASTVVVYGNPCVVQPSPRYSNKYDETNLLKAQLNAADTNDGYHSLVLEIKLNEKSNPSFAYAGDHFSLRSSNGHARTVVESYSGVRIQEGQKSASDGQIVVTRSKPDAEGNSVYSVYFRDCSPNNANGCLEQKDVVIRLADGTQHRLNIRGAKLLNPGIPERPKLVGEPKGVPDASNTNPSPQVASKRPTGDAKLKSEGAGAENVASAKEGESLTTGRATGTWKAEPDYSIPVPKGVIAEEDIRSSKRPPEKDDAVVASAKVGERRAPLPTPPSLAKVPVDERDAKPIPPKVADVPKPQLEEVPSLNLPDPPVGDKLGSSGKDKLKDEKPKEVTPPSPPKVEPEKPAPTTPPAPVYTAKIPGVHLKSDRLTKKYLEPNVNVEKMTTWDGTPLLAREMTYDELRMLEAHIRGATERQAAFAYSARSSVTNKLQHNFTAELVVTNEGTLTGSCMIDEALSRTRVKIFVDYKHGVFVWDEWRNEYQPLGSFRFTDGKTIVPSDQKSKAGRLNKMLDDLEAFFEK